MKKPTRGRPLRATSLIFFLFSVFLVSCQNNQEREFDRAESAIRKKNFQLALNLLNYTIKRNPENDLALKAAREGVRVSIFELKDYKKAVDFNKILVLASQNPEERVSAQKEIANIYFEHLQDYQASIEEFNKLLQMQITDYEKAKYKVSISRAHFYMGNFFQAESEILEIIRLKLDSETKFAANVLYGNILVAKKEFDRAADIYRGLIKDFPDLSLKENVPLTLAVCYEESKDFPNAIKALEIMQGRYQPAEYIELRIKRLKERLKNQPGAKGFRK